MQPFIIDTPFGFGIDLTMWADFLSQPAGEIAKGAFAVVLWWMVVLFLFRLILSAWLKEKQAQYSKNWRYSMLAVDVPALFIQSPKSVEQIFVQLSGALMKINLFDKYMLGKMQKSFSFEIVSLEGYIQFLIRTEEEFRDLVEAAIYAQYPEAEIIEVEDYVLKVPDKYPRPDYDVEGVEFSLTENEAYPIKTYPHFEYSSALEKEVSFTDPMAAILENFTRIGKGEHCWLQLVIAPSDNSWKKTGIDLVKEIIENKPAKSSLGLANKVAGIPMAAMKTAVQAWNVDYATGTPEEKKEDAVGKLSDLTPGKKGVVEAIEEKISKFGFRVKMRVLYAGQMPVFNPQKCLSGIIGAFNQFYTADMNSLTAERVSDEKIVAAFKSRDMRHRGDPYILNIEELATLWHFPLPMVKTPLLQKAALKRSEPPIDLPTDLADDIFGENPSLLSGPEVVSEPEEELPYG